MTARAERKARINVENFAVAGIVIISPARTDKKFFTDFNRVEIFLPVVRPVFFFYILYCYFKTSEIEFSFFSLCSFKSRFYGIKCMLCKIRGKDIHGSEKRKTAQGDNKQNGKQNTPVFKSEQRKQRTGKGT